MSYETMRDECPNCHERGMPMWKLHYFKGARETARACQICQHVEEREPVEEETLP